MWKPEHRRAAERHGLRYPSDLRDGEWALVDPMIPPAKRGGHGREVNVREVLRRFFSFIRCIFADAESKRAASIAKTGTWKLTIVQRDELQRFTFAWISHNRRLARDFERYARSATAFIRLLSSEPKCNTPADLIIGTVDQDLRECCHAMLFAFVG